MKSSELSNGGNRIALRQLLQNRNFNVGAFYNITNNRDNPIKTVGRDSFFEPKTS